VHGFQERRGVGARVRLALVVGLRDRHMHILRRARAALLLLASWLLALQLALGLLAVGGLDALVVALQLFAHGRALGLGSRASGVALGGGTHCLALGAVFLLAVVLGAANRANGAFAVHHTFGALGLFTSHFTLGSCTDGVANSRALRIIALPSALGMALFSQHQRAQGQQGN